MAKGHYQGGGTIIGPRDTSWFGEGKVKQGVGSDAKDVAARRANPLTPDVERRIGNLRIDVKGLDGQIASLEQQRDALINQRKRSQQELADILSRHGLPPDPGLPAPTPKHPAPGTTKTTRNQRRKRAKDKATDAS